MICYAFVMFLLCFAMFCYDSLCFRYVFAMFCYALLCFDFLEVLEASKRSRRLRESGVPSPFCTSHHLIILLNSSVLSDCKAEHVTFRKKKDWEVERKTSPKT